MLHIQGVDPRISVDKVEVLITCHKPGVLGGPYKTRSPRMVHTTARRLLGKSVDDPIISQLRPEGSNCGWVGFADATG